LSSTFIAERSLAATLDARAGDPRRRRRQFIPDQAVFIRDQLLFIQSSAFGHPVRIFIEESTVRQPAAGVNGTTVDRSSNRVGVGLAGRLPIAVIGTIGGTPG
jgi:hypothetical protein